jgi:hypothetical protein
MIVMMKRDIAPLCDRHHGPMQLAQFGASNIALTFIAYKCLADSCLRAYQHGSGYVDIADFVSVEDGFRRDCPEDEMTMYLAEIDPNGTEVWCCGQLNCEYSEAVNPHERFGVMIRPIEVRNQEPSEKKPYSQLEAVGISNGARWIGPCQPWDVTLVLLSSFRQNSAQLVGVRSSLLEGTPAELVGRAAPLGVTEQQLMKAGLKRLRTKGIAIAS